MGFETPKEGYLAKIFIEAGTRDIPIGKLLCIIVEDQEDVAKFADFDASSVAETPPAAPTPVNPVSAPKQVSTPTGGRVFASPAAKRVAAERGIDLSQIKSGSGMDGMITSKDVENFTPAAVAAAPSMTAPPLTSFPAVTGPVTDIEASNVRKVIAKRLQQSKQTVPHYYLTVECNMEKTMKLRKEINTSYE